MVKLSEMVGIKWIVGYVDSYGKVYHKVVKLGDPMDTHEKLWPTIHHNNGDGCLQIPNILILMGYP